MNQGSFQRWIHQTLLLVGPQALHPLLHIHCSSLTAAFAWTGAMNTMWSIHATTQPTRLYMLDWMDVPWKWNLPYVQGVFGDGMYGLWGRNKNVHSLPSSFFSMLPGAIGTGRGVAAIAGEHGSIGLLHLFMEVSLWPWPYNSGSGQAPYRILHLGKIALVTVTCDFI